MKSNQAHKNGNDDLSTSTSTSTSISSSFVTVPSLATSTTRGIGCCASPPHLIRFDSILYVRDWLLLLYNNRNLLTLVTGATLFGAHIGNHFLFVDIIVTVGLPILVDLLALVFLLIEFEGLLVLASALHIANTRARLKSNLLHADFLLFRFLEGLQGIASSGFLLADFEFFLAVGAWTLGFRSRANIRTLTPRAFTTIRVILEWTTTS